MRSELEVLQNKLSLISCGEFVVGENEYEEIVLNEYTKPKTVEELSVPYGIEVVDLKNYKSLSTIKTLRLPTTCYKLGRVFRDICNITENNVLEEIDSKAFYENYALKEITLPCVESLGSYCFAKSSLEKIIIGDTLVFIDEGAFRESKLKEISIGDGVSEIPANCFYGCSELEKVTLPNSIREVHYSAFEKCTSLKELYIPDSCTLLSHSALAECTNLYELSVPSLNVFKCFKTFLSDNANRVARVPLTIKVRNNYDISRFNDNFFNGLSDVNLIVNGELYEWKPN